LLRKELLPPSTIASIGNQRSTPNNRKHRKSTLDAQPYSLFLSRMSNSKAGKEGLGDHLSLVELELAKIIASTSSTFAYGGSICIVR
jgi:hypothetical protein